MGVGSCQGRWKMLVFIIWVFVARYNWPHSFWCAARCLKSCQISCHNKRYIQLSQSRPCTGKVQTRHEYIENLYITMLWSFHVVESSGCKHDGGKRYSLLWQKRWNSHKILMNRLIKGDEKASVSNLICVSYIRPCILRWSTKKVEMLHCHSSNSKNFKAPVAVHVCRGIYSSIIRPKCALGNNFSTLGKNSKF